MLEIPPLRAVLAVLVCEGPESNRAWELAACKHAAGDAVHAGFGYFAPIDPRDPTPRWTDRELCASVRRRTRVSLSVIACRSPIARIGCIENERRSEVSGRTTAHALIFDQRVETPMSICVCGLCPGDYRQVIDWETQIAHSDQQ